jgi:hypothetical protein
LGMRDELGAANNAATSWRRAPVRRPRVRRAGEGALRG